MPTRRVNIAGKLRDRPLSWRGLAILCVLSLLTLAGCAIVPQWRPAVTRLGTEAPTGGRVELPLVFLGGQAFIQGRDERGDYLVLLDTGCRDVTLMPRLAQTLHTRDHLVFPSISTDSSGIARWSWTAARVEKFSLGPARFESFDSDIVDFGELFTGTTPPVGAIAGLDLFHDCLMTIDGPKQRLVLDRGELPPENGRDILAYRWQQVGNLEVEVLLAGQKRWAKLDTGNADALSVSEDWAGDLSLDVGSESHQDLLSLFGQCSHRVGTLNGELQLGQYRFNHPHVDIGGRSGQLLIGAPLLVQFCLTLDQKNKRVRLVRG